MEDKKTKDRGWVKNVAIIILAILLILTFFSNTIMNRSLPEVATRSIRGGSITAQIRGSGTVAANQNYSVTIDQSRKIKSVMVREGQTVNAGDVLFVLTGDSTELENAQEQLSSLQRQYQRELLNASGTDYAQQDRAIAQAREALENAEQERDALAVDEALIDQQRLELENRKAQAQAAQRPVEHAQEQLTALQEQQTEAERGYSHSTEGTGWSGGSTAAQAEAVRTAQRAADEAANLLSAANLSYGDDYYAFEQRARERLYQDYAESHETPLEENSGYYAEMLPYYLTETVSHLQSRNAELAAMESNEETEMELDTNRRLLTAYEKITQARSDYDTARERLSAAQEVLWDAENSATYDGGKDYNGKTHNYYAAELERLEPLVYAAQKDLDQATAAKTAADQRVQEAEATLNDYIAARDKFTAAQERVTSAQNSLEDLLFSLEQTKRQDEKSAQLRWLDLQEMLENIEKARQKVEELTEGSTQDEILADVGGIIGTLNVTAGNTTTPGSPLTTIEIPDMGYTLTFSVTTEQARRVHVGDPASAANLYWGNQVEATVQGIRPDPRDPQNTRILTFEVKGDVNPGSTLTLTVGQRSAEYDYVVPNSALRSDSNGDFVLIVTAKSSPLGDRYTATRVDITKLANDDNNTAVSGALNYGDFLITTSTAPLQNGQRVRLADSQT